MDEQDQERLDALADERDDLCEENTDLRAELRAAEAECDELLGKIEMLRDALRLLYEEEADYIRVNHLCDVHHNRSMQMARDALAKTT